MADNPTDKTPDAIKKHQPQKTFEMKGPMGSAIRQDHANHRVEKDIERLSGNRAEKYANIEKEKFTVTVKDMEAGTRGILSKEYSKSSKDLEK